MALSHIKFEACQGKTFQSLDILPVTVTFIPLWQFEKRKEMGLLLQSTLGYVSPGHQEGRSIGGPVGLPTLPVGFDP